MARLITSGFELNDTSSATGPDGSGNNGGTFSTSTVRTGTYSLKIDTTTTASASQQITFSGGSTTTTYFWRAYVNFSAINTAGSGEFSGVLGTVPGGLSNIGIALNNASQLQFLAGGVLTGSTYTPSLGQWFRLEFSYQSSSGAWEWRVDGVTIATGTQTSGSAPGDLRCGAFSRSTTPPTYTAFFDDVALNDTNAGTGQTSWAGSGRVVLLTPATDNANGTGWTNDAASTTNLFDAVDNKPPVGIADTTGSTGLHQIRNATSNANVNYDANLTTYTAAGVGSSDTVNVVVPVVATAAPVTTSAKQGTYGIVSNPAITNVALGAGGTSGAFWSGTAAGTYPTGWKWSLGTTTYAPTVTVGNAPVARITQVTSSTRIAMVCAMGMYVDYTPAATAQLISQPSNLSNFGML